MQKHELGKLIASSDAQVVLPTNSIVANLTIRQVIHHQNLNCFTPLKLWHEFRPM